jgi:GNAT superfamily N-acetyltransferase
VQIVEYEPSRRADVADLMERVWGKRPEEAELEWFYERNPLRPASVLLAEEDGRTVGTAAIAFVPMSIGGERLEVGMPLRVATDPDYRGRGIFRELEEANEERVRGLGVRLLLTVPNAASAPVFLGKLGWSSLPPIKVWSRWRLWSGRPGASAVERFSDEIEDAPGDTDRVLRDATWLNWRYTESPTEYKLVEGGGGYAIATGRGRLGVVAAVKGDLLRDAGRAARGKIVIAALPPWLQRGRASMGYLPTGRKFTLLGKSLHPDQPVPAQPHFELGDLDFL